MSTNKQGIVHGASEGGVLGEHPDPPPFKFLVGPSTTTELNTLRVPLVPILCWKVEDIRFAFDSSFVTGNPDNSPDQLTNPSDPTSDPTARPFSKEKGDIRDELQMLAEQISILREKYGTNPGCPLSVFGHADPVGPAVNPDGYNKALSDRRATAIYALLISGTPAGATAAAQLWQGIATQEGWATKQQAQVQKMQQVTGLPAGTSMGTLISNYLPKLLPPEFVALKLGPKDFLAQGNGSGGKGDYQGCSSFNPLIIFSQANEDKFAPGANDQNQTVYDERNLANAPNRRVMVLVFPKGSKVDPNKWPCPSAQGMQTYADYSACTKRFWSNGQARRSTRLPDDDRKYAKTQDTFGCRFYDRLMRDSPGYRELVSLRIRLLDDRVIDGEDETFDGLSYRLEVGEMESEGVAEKGIIEQLIPKGVTTGKLTLVKKPENGDPVDLWVLNLVIADSLADSTQIAGAQVRLNNLGLYASDEVTGQVDAQTGRALQRFQALYKVTDAQGNPDTGGNLGFLGTLTSQTANKLKEKYGS